MQCTFTLNKRFERIEDPATTLSSRMIPNMPRFTNTFMSDLESEGILRSNKASPLDIVKRWRWRGISKFSI